MTTSNIRLSAEVTVAGAVGLLGGLPPAVLTLLVLMALDFATGLLAGYIAGELDSGVSYKGLAKKALVLIAVAGSSYLEVSLGLPVTGIVSTAIAGFYSMHEALSVLETLVRADLPVPEFLKRALALAKEKHDA